MFVHNTYFILLFQQVRYFWTDTLYLRVNCLAANNRVEIDAVQLVGKGYCKGKIRLLNSKLA